MEIANFEKDYSLEEIQAIAALEKITLEVRKLANKIPLNQRVHLLSLCYLICATSGDKQDEFADFLDNYVADRLVSRIIQDGILQRLFKNYLKKFPLNKDLNKLVLKSYIRQFYIHSDQDLNTKHNLYLEVVLRLIHNSDYRNNFFSYILGCEVIKMMFQMSWFQHERLYQLQKNQENFIKTYIKPIQYTHRIHGIIFPKHENVFFAKRDYFVKRPNIPPEQLIDLVISTFSKDTITNLGFLIIRNLNFFVFDYDYIFNSEPTCIFIV